MTPPIDSEVLDAARKALVASATMLAAAHVHATLWRNDPRAAATVAFREAALDASALGLAELLACSTDLTMGELLDALSTDPGPEPVR